MSHNMVQPYPDRDSFKRNLSRIHSFVNSSKKSLALKRMILELKPILNIPKATLLIRYTLFKDNKGAEELANVPKNRPRTKHIAVKYHHFHEAVKSKILMVERVDTIYQ